MPTISDLPEDIPDFGLLFDYSVWGPGTEVTLCHVPWDSMYRDVYWFDAPVHCISYIHKYNREMGMSVTRIENLTYCAQNRPVRISVPFSEANKYNYLIVQNDRMPLEEPNSPVTFFYFITSVEYIAPNTTQLTVSLDVWQTYHHVIDFGGAYVEKCHALEYKSQDLIANKLGVSHIKYANKYFRCPEGIDLGQRMMIAKSWVESYLDTKAGALDNRFKFTAIIVSTVNLEGDWGSASNPTMSTAYGSNVKMTRSGDYKGQPASEGMRLVSGATYYSCPLEKLADVMKSMSNYPWISQGIQDIYIVPQPNVAVAQISGKAGEAGLNKVVEIVGHTVCTAAYDFRPDLLWQFFNSEPDIKSMLGIKAMAYLKRFMKFYQSPYMVIECTPNNGQVITIDPLLLASYSVQFHVEWHILPPSPRMTAYIDNYNAFRQASVWKSDCEYVNEALVIDNFPHVPVVNDNSIMAYASHAHSIAQSRASAGWGRDKALRGAQNSFDQTMHGIRTGNAIMENNLGAQNLQTALANTAQQAHQQVANANRAVSGIGGAVGSALTGNFKGAFGGLGGYMQGQITADINTGIDINARNMGNVISQNLTRANQSESNMLTGSNAKANLDLANYAARGDYSNAIASINAGIQDTETVSPSIGGGVGGDAANWVQNGAVIYSRLRMVDPAAIIRQGDMWARYGYTTNSSINQFPKRLQCMDRFSYWKCLDVRLKSAKCPQMFIETIRGILEKGVTVWHEPLKEGEVLDKVMVDNTTIKWEGDMFYA